MLRISLALVAILASLSTSDALVLPAGKCKDITPDPIDYNELIKFPQWRFLYYPDGEPFNNVDSEVADVSHGENNEVHVVRRMRMKNNTISSDTSKVYYGSDKVVYEEVTRDDGEKLVFKIIPLHSVPSEMDFLFYRCSDNGSLDYDTRYVVILSGNSMSVAGERELVDKDASFNFTGGIQKLDSKLEWSRTED